MAADACPGVIVSSNRANDVVPYASHVYHAEPEKWGSVLPWQFPQDASRQDEEDFLRRFFTNTEIHMQGGANGEGRGFRFLKTVWYTNAEWNAYTRVPLVEQWFWEQPDNLNILDDPSTRPFWFAEAAQASTFFQKAEMDLYGNTLLTAVVPRIQLTARTLLDEQRRGVKADKAHATAISRHFTSVIQPPVRPTGDHNAQQGTTTITTSSESKSQSLRTPSVAASDTPAQPAGAEPVHSKFSVGKRSFSHDMPSSQARRGNQSNVRYNNRNEQHRHPDGQTGAGHNAFHQPPFAYRGPSVPYNSRAISSVHPQGMHSIPQGHTVPPGFQPMHHGAPQHANVSPMQQPVMPHPTSYTSGPHYFDPNAFGSYREPSYEFERGYPQQDYGTRDAGRGNQRGRRNSMSGRGRGQGSVRGRGSSRGRNSFSSADQAPYRTGSEFHNRQDSSQRHSDAAPWNERNGRGMATNWRSVSDRPQDAVVEHATKENTMPGRAFSGSYAYDMPAGFAGYNKPPFGVNESNRSTSSRLQSQSQGPVWMPNSLANYPPPGDLLNNEQKCTREEIFPGYVGAVKLVVFNVPNDMTKDELRRVLGQWGDFSNVGIKSRGEFQAALAFVGFNDAQAAREFLLNKPATWLKGQELRVEVSREHWDPSHLSCQRRFGSSSKIATSNIGRRESTVTEQVMPVPTVLRRLNGEAYSPGIFSGNVAPVKESASEETTPTPSGANTPKSANKKKGKSAKPAKQTHGLRQASLTINTDGMQSSQKPQPVTQTPELANADTSGPIPPAAEVQSSCGPTFSPPDDIRTRLPSSEGPTHHDEVQASVLLEGNLHVDSDDQVSPKSMVAVPALRNDQHQPHASDTGEQPFRDDQATEEKTQTAQVDSPLLLAVDIDTGSKQTPPEPPSTDDKSEGSSAARSRPPACRDDLDRDSHTTTIANIPFNVAASERGDVPAAASMTSGSDAPRSDSSSAPTNRVNSATDTVAVTAVRGTKPKVAISIAAPLKNTQTKYERRSTSGDTLAPPTPGYVTAPSSALNTPVIGHTTSAPEDDPLPTSNTITQGDVLAIATKTLPSSWGTEASTENVSTSAEVLDKAAKAEENRLGSEETAAGSIAEAALGDAEVPSDQESCVQQTSPVEAEVAIKPDNGEVADEAEEADNVEKSEKAKKIEKAKGPAQTESFSLFGKGKGKDRKPKLAKRGTVKGKPAVEEQSADVKADQSTLAASTNKTSTRRDSKIAKDTKTFGKTSNDKCAVPAIPKTTRLELELTAMAEMVTAAEARSSTEEIRPPCRDESPTKRKGSKLGEFLGRFLPGGGAQSQAPAQDILSHDKPFTESTLTDSTAQDLPPKREIKQNDEAIEDRTGREEDDEHTGGLDNDEADLTESHGAVTNGADSEPGGVLSPDEGGEKVTVGLGITDTPMGDATVDTAKSKKKKRKPSKKKDKSDKETGDAEPSQASTPAAESRLHMFHFGSDEPAPPSNIAMTPAISAEDAVSMSPSTAQHGDTSVADPQSPSAISSKKKLTITANSGHIVLGKRATWKNKKRPRREAAGDDEGEVDSPGYVVMNGSETSEEGSGREKTPPSESDGHSRQRLYIYVADTEHPKETAHAEAKRKLEESGRGSNAVSTAG